MVGAVDGGPSYISSHSADVILSDIRPIKLKPEALRAINVLLDEFLSKILSTSCSLAPDKLRASLLNLLPTSLGKEALLEAEVELRAYWERTDPKGTVEDDSRTFHLQWAFSLLRLKCEAYSTLNEQDEDPTAESRVNETFEKVHPHPPNSTLLDPAALYLTAILESMCEHILSNVGRVAARDSSRTNATVNDLFVALCEDDSIYGLFRTMKVYEQIEVMSQTPKSRRSNSRSLSVSRPSSQQELTPVHSSSGSRSRQSSEGQLTMQVTSSTTSSRASFEKARAIRMFTNGNNKDKITPEAEVQNDHKRSESSRSEASRPFSDEDSVNPAEDAEMLREFDDLMRTTATMKVSLTPDRLKTMEVYKQEKDQRSMGRRPGTQVPEAPSPSPSRTNSQKPISRHVDAIVEDDEDPQIPKTRARQASIAIPPSSSFIPPVPTRSRSISTSSGLPTPFRNPTRNTSVTAVPSSFSRSTGPSSPLDMIQSRDFRGAKAPSYNGMNNNNGFPARTRVKQRNRDSLDLDDVMNGSDGDDEPQPPQPIRQPPRSPSTPKRANAPQQVSAKTRELMDFLAEGPPEPPVSKDGRELMTFLADGPPDYGSNMNDSTKPKGAGRLQRMISKLNLGNAEKVKVPPEPVRAMPPMIMPTPPRPPVIQPQPPYGPMSSLANRPIPPRPAPPISPPSSPSQSQSHDSSDENKSLRNPPPRKSYQDIPVSRNSPTIEKIPSFPPSPIPTPITVNQDTSAPERVVSRRPSPPNVVSNGSPRTEKAPKDVLVVPHRVSSNPPIRKPVPAITPVSSPSIPEHDVRDMQRLLTSATTADECRLIIDMFMARNGMPKVSKVQAIPYPSPTPSVVKHSSQEDQEGSLESSLVEFFLGGSAATDVAAHHVQPVSQSQSQSQSQLIDGLPREATNSLAQTAVVPPEVSTTSPTHIAIPV